MKPAIRVTEIAKRFRLGARPRDSYRTLREAIADAAATPVHWLRRKTGSAGADEEDPRGQILWALRDVSFEIEPGEVVGIIGGNGAGKSTLLKILSRVTEPTSGRVELWGRVGSLLEVGTGFHSELTGRENIYLSGAILGMTRREIGRKFDTIVDFADVERFLDTPVKHYSSGMHVRLAFAVAAHLEPEILIVDEVLAVGDAQFQKKCLGKMEEVSRGGRTVLFVSHNMNVVQRLCRQVILLQKGRLVDQGDTEEMVVRYLAHGPERSQPGAFLALDEVGRKGSQEVRCTGVSFTSRNPRAGNWPFPDGPIEVTVTLESDSARMLTHLAVVFSDRNGTRLINASTVSLGKTLSLRPGRNECTVRLEQLHLTPGIYNMDLFLANPGLVFDYVEAAAQVEVVDLPGAGFGKRPDGDGRVTCELSLVG